MKKAISSVSRSSLLDILCARNATDHVSEEVVAMPWVYQPLEFLKFLWDVRHSQMTRYFRQVFGKTVSTIGLQVLSWNLRSSR